MMETTSKRAVPVAALCLGQDSIEISRRYLQQLGLGSDWDLQIITKQSTAQELRTGTHVFILLTDVAVSLAEIDDFFSTHPFLRDCAIKICAFRESPQSIDAGLIHHFDDFIFLPCAAQECHSRLLLLCQRSCANPQESVNSHEFTELNLRGSSPIFIRTLQLIKQVATCDASVLIEGETGTGKENAARAIHYLSSRNDKAFVPINCGAIPDNLLESELFGFERGAFTDAKQKQQGLVAIAHQGTLFLDEVDSLSIKAQAALLRFLQTGEYRPLGSGTTQRANVRILAATNADLTQLIKKGVFREDLYFRLNVLYVRMPPLRERSEDIGEIAHHLLKKYLCQYGRGAEKIHPTSLHWLQQQPWPGNVRELENVLLREFLLTGGDTIRLPMTRSGPAMPKTESLSREKIRFQDAKEAAISQFECDYLRHLLAMTAGNVTEAAQLAGKERRALGKLIKKYNIDKTQFLHGATNRETGASQAI